VSEDKAASDARGQGPGVSGASFRLGLPRSAQFPFKGLADGIVGREESAPGPS
jgi:hypothetical protein